MRLAFLLILAVLFALASRAQAPQGKRCLTQSAEQVLSGEFPSRMQMEEFEAWMAAKRLGKARKLTGEPEPVYVVPVVFHIIHNGEPVGTGTNLDSEAVHAQLEVLNQDFRRLNADRAFTPALFRPAAADTRIEFRLAELDTNHNPLPEPGISRYNGERAEWTPTAFNRDVKPVTGFDPARFLNIWVAKLSGAALGYSTWPRNTTLDGVPNNTAPRVQDGVVINTSVLGSNYTHRGPMPHLNDSLYDKGRTCSHEIGHYFGLLHPWGFFGGCNDDDFCEDTPPTSRGRDDVAAPCVFPDFELPSTCPDTYDNGEDAPDMFQNFMDYTADGCMNLFTNDQTDRMRIVLEFATDRSDLLKAQVIKPHFPPSQLSVQADEAGKPVLSWQDNTLNKENFAVERSEQAEGPFTVIARLPAEVTTFTDTDAQIDHVYYYRIFAENAAGHSQASAPARFGEAMTLPIPQNLTAQAIGPDAIRLQWLAAPHPATAFVLEAATGNTDFEAVALADLPNGQTEQLLQGLEAKTTYHFRLRSTDGMAISEASAPAIATTLAEVPDAPVRVSAVFERINRQMLIEWEDNALDEDEFAIERAVGGHEAFTEVATAPANSTAFLDAEFNVPPAATVRYRLRSRNAAGTSHPSFPGTFDALTSQPDNPALAELPLAYPNPFREMLYIEPGKLGLAPVQVALYGMDGKHIGSFGPFTTTQQVSLHLPALSPGVYLLRLTSAEGTYALRIYKKP